MEQSTVGTQPYACSHIVILSIILQTWMAVRYPSAMAMSIEVQQPMEQLIVAFDDVMVYITFVPINVYNYLVVVIIAEVVVGVIIRIHQLLEEIVQVTLPTYSRKLIAA